MPARPPGSTARRRLRHRPSTAVQRRCDLPCHGRRARVQLPAGPSRVLPGRGSTGDERLGDRPERAELLLRRGLGPHRPPRRGPRAAVVLITHRRLAGRDQDMLGDDLPGAGHDDQQPPVISAQPDLRADQPDGHGVAGRGEPHARQPVHLAGDHASRCWPAATAAGRAVPARSPAARPAPRRSRCAPRR